MTLIGTRLRRISSVFAIGIGYLITALALLITAEVIGRKIFNYSFQGVDEIGGYVVAVTASFGFAYALLQQAHTRIDVFIRLVKGVPRGVLNVLALICFCFFSAFAAWRAMDVVSVSYKFQTVSSSSLGVLLWVPQAIWFLGLIFLFLVSLFLAVRGIVVFCNDPNRLANDDLLTITDSRNN